MNKNIFYNAHHSPVGAFASFTLGFKGASGGLGISLAKPACQNVYIGAETETPGMFKALPFYKCDRDRPAAVEPDNWGERPKGAVVEPFEDGEITREITPAIDTWRAGDMEFTIYTPCRPVVDPRNCEVWPNDMGSAIIPAVFVELTLDNTKCQHARKIFFGYEGNDPYTAMRLFVDGTDKVSGVGQGRITGIFTDDGDAVCATAFSPNELLVDDITDRLPFRLGTTGLVRVTVPAGEKRTARFAVCFYMEGVVTSGKETSYLYTRYYKNIEDAARYGLDHFELYKRAAVEFDEKLSLHKLTDDRRFLLSMAIKSYYGSTQLLVDEEENPVWVVVEGGYRMINTLDLAVDHLFFEMMMNPWSVRSVLEQYADHYSYYDEVKNLSGDVFPGGISFTHDMGVAGVFSPKGRSAYELSGLSVCYSYMTQEQLVNWILCAGVYWSGTGDDTWLKSYHYTIKDCLTSMVNRDAANAKDRDGVMDLDTCKTGSGAEITTYDNVDTALGQARRSSYIAVKCWAAYLLLEKMLTKLGLTDDAKTASIQADKSVNTILKYIRDDGTIPAILEAGNEAATLSIVEGLIYPYVAGVFDDPAFINKYGDFIAALKKHFEVALTSGCKFPNGGWKMSKTSSNSWPSKTFLIQFIVERIFNLDPDHHADKIHASWLIDPDNAFYAFSDQMKTGKVCGSSYYPRGVTAILFSSIS